MASKKKVRGDVDWHVPKRKTPIITTTRACSDIITACMGDMTIQEYYNKIITGEFIYDGEVISVLKAYIDKGYGDWVCKEHFLSLDVTLPHWEKFYKGYFGNFTNPLWRCSKCRSKESEHVYDADNPLTECPFCHTKLGYTYVTVRGLSLYDY